MSSRSKDVQNIVSFQYTCANRTLLARKCFLQGTSELEGLYMVGRDETARAYQPISSYGVIGDCRSAVLIAPDGAVDWACLPDFDSPAIFCRLLDASRGGYCHILLADCSI